MYVLRLKNAHIWGIFHHIQFTPNNQTPQTPCLVNSNPVHPIWTKIDLRGDPQILVEKKSIQKNSGDDSKDPQGRPPQVGPPEGDVFRCSMHHT